MGQKYSKTQTAKLKFQLVLRTKKRVDNITRHVETPCCLDLVSSQEMNTINIIKKFKISVKSPKGEIFFLGGGGLTGCFN